MTTEDAFLQDIIAQPQDDGLRLVFADFCEDNDQPERGEFIKVQIRLAHIDTYIEAMNGLVGAITVEADELRLREQELWRSRRHGTWTIPGPLMPPTHTCLSSDATTETLQIPVLVFRRGFANEVRCTLADWMEYGPLLARTAPLERVVITDRKPHLFPTTDVVDVSGKHLWQWCADDVPHDYRLPKSLMSALLKPHKGGCYSTHSGRTINTYYDTREAADEMLSQACLLLARERK